MHIKKNLRFLTLRGPLVSPSELLLLLGDFSTEICDDGGWGGQGDVAAQKALLLDGWEVEGMFDDWSASTSGTYGTRPSRILEMVMSTFLVLARKKTKISFREFQLNK